MQQAPLRVAADVRAFYGTREVNRYERAAWSHIVILTITLEIASKQALFVLLAKDGTVNRMGSGSPSTADGHLFIGRTAPPLLPEVGRNVAHSPPPGPMTSGEAGHALQAQDMHRVR